MLSLTFSTNSGFAFSQNPHHYYSKKNPNPPKTHENIWMEYSFFHKNRFLFSTNHRGPVGIAGLKQKSVSKCLASSQFYTEQEWVVTLT